MVVVLNPVPDLLLPLLGLGLDLLLLVLDVADCVPLLDRTKRNRRVAKTRVANRRDANICVTNRHNRHVAKRRVAKRRIVSRHIVNRRISNRCVAKILAASTDLKKLFLLLPVVLQ